MPRWSDRGVGAREIDPQGAGGQEDERDPGRCPFEPRGPFANGPIRPRGSSHSDLGPIDDYYAQSSFVAVTWNPSGAQVGYAGIYYARFGNARGPSSARS